MKNLSININTPTINEIYESIKKYSALKTLSENNSANISYDLSKSINDTVALIKNSTKPNQFIKGFIRAIYNEEQEFFIDFLNNINPQDRDLLNNFFYSLFRECAFVNNEIANYIMRTMIERKFIDCTNSFGVIFYEVIMHPLTNIRNVNVLKNLYQYYEESDFKIIIPNEINASIIYTNDELIFLYTVKTQQIDFLDYLISNNKLKAMKLENIDSNTYSNCLFYNYRIYTEFAHNELNKSLSHNDMERAQHMLKKALQIVNLCFEKIENSALIEFFKQHLTTLPLELAQTFQHIENQHQQIQIYHLITKKCHNFIDVGKFAIELHKQNPQQFNSMLQAMFATMNIAEIAIAISENPELYDDESIDHFLTKIHLIDIDSFLKVIIKLKNKKLITKITSSDKIHLAIQGYIQQQLLYLELDKQMLDQTISKNIVKDTDLNGEQQEHPNHH
jgi:hypothetical protein